MIDGCAVVVEGLVTEFSIAREVGPRWSLHLHLDNFIYLSITQSKQVLLCDCPWGLEEVVIIITALAVD